MIDLIQSVNSAIESEGIGESIWGERDCVSFIRAVISAHGIEPQFSLPQGYDHVKSELEAIKETIRRFGSMKLGWLDAIKREPSLQIWEKEPVTGMICMSKETYTLNGLEGNYGPVLGVFGADMQPWARTPLGIAVIHPIEYVWRIVT